MSDQLPILVIAGNYRQFVYWCREHEISPSDTKRVRYVSEPHVVLGRHGNPYVTVGTFYGRRDMSEIYRELRIIEAVPLGDKSDG